MHTFWASVFIVLSLVSPLIKNAKWVSVKWHFADIKNDF